MNMAYKTRTIEEIEHLAKTLGEWAIQFADVAEAMKRKQITEIFCSHDNAYQAILRSIEGFHGGINRAITRHPSHSPKNQKEWDQMKKSGQKARLGKRSQARK